MPSTRRSRSSPSVGAAAPDGSVPSILARLATLVRADGGLLAAAIGPGGWAGVPSPYGDAGAGAPRGAGHIADLPLVIEAVREGYLLHYGTPRLMSRDDDDLALLAGDRLYALGLERLAGAGDLAAVSGLSDPTRLSGARHPTDCSALRDPIRPPPQAQAAGDAPLADAVWAAGCAKLGWGSSSDL